MSSNIFSSSNKDSDTFKDTVDTHSKTLLTVVQRQKDVESKLDLLEEKLELYDHNSVKNFKKIFDELKEIRTDFRDLKQEISLIKDFNSKVRKQIKLMTTKDEVTKLEKYIDLWNPMNFVTKQELIDSQKKTVEELKKIVEGFMREENSKKVDKK